MEMEEESTFVQELLAFLDSTDDPSSLSLDTLDASTPSRVSSKLSKRRSNRTRSDVRNRNERARLQTEVTALTTQLERLRGAVGAEWAIAKHYALAERRERRRAEDECRRLRQAVYTQRRFIGGLRSVFSGAPRLALKLDLSRYLHLHTRLARHRHTRWMDFDKEAHDARLRLAMEVLCHETEAMTLDDDPTIPFVNGEIHDDDHDCFKSTTTAVYAVDTSDLSAVVRATCVAIRDDATLCASGHTLSVARDVIDVDASPASNMLYRVLLVQHPCESMEDFVMQTHVITSHKITDDVAVVVWDFVDVDEQHPTTDTTTVSRTVTGACLIRHEWCADGVERTIFRSLVTKRLRFLDPGSNNNLRESWCRMHPLPIICSKEMIFRRVLMDQLAAEKAIYHTQHLHVE